MASRKKKIILGSILALLVLLLAAAVYFFQFSDLGYRMSVPCRQSFEKIAENIYVNRGYAGDREALLQLSENARARVGAFFGDVQGTDATIVIFCDDEKLQAKLGSGKDTTTVTFPVKRNYISISEEYCDLDILAHELTHAELHTRLNEKPLRALPTWFNEGIAVQNDYREQYGAQAWEEQTDHGKNVVALTDMDTPDEFYAGSAEDRRFRYLNARHEVGEWMETHGQAGLLALIDRLNGGEDFDTVYRS